jgi:hypothetical protein
MTTYKGVLVRCKKPKKTEAELCVASEVENQTPWQLIKSLSKCQEQARARGETCHAAIAFDQDTKQVVKPESLEFEYP